MTVAILWDNVLELEQAIKALYEVLPADVRLRADSHGFVSACGVVIESLEYIKSLQKVKDNDFLKETSPIVVSFAQKFKSANVPQIPAPNVHVPSGPVTVSISSGTATSPQTHIPVRNASLIERILLSM